MLLIFGKDIDRENAIIFDYDERYQIIDYVIPVGEDRRGMTLYSVPEDDFIRTMRAVYGKDEILQNVTATLNGHETLLYIHYENEEHVKQELRKFAIRNADAMIEQIQQFTDVAARLFIDYFCDGEYMDYHAMIGTAEQMEAIRQKYPDEDCSDNSGNYPSEFIEGDNEMLKTLVRCAQGYPSENFQYVVDIMSKHIEEYALPTLRKTEDFKYICNEYDWRMSVICKEKKL